VSVPVLLPVQRSGAISALQRTERFFHRNSTTNTQPPDTKTEDKMASDEDYASFLDKANEDPSAGTAKSQSKGKAELKTTDTEVPAALKKATSDAFYVSDADEPFVPVALKFSGKSLPDEGTIIDLLSFLFGFCGNGWLLTSWDSYLCKTGKPPKSQGSRGWYSGYWRVGCSRAI